MPTTSCNVASLEVYVPSGTNPWNKQKVNHLYRRIGFGASPEMLTAALNQSPSQLIDNLVDEAINTLPSATPEWGYWTRDDFNNAPMEVFEYRRMWKIQMVDELFQNGLRERLTLFWSNHFVTEDNVYNSPSYMFQYYHLLQLHATGNFKQFTYDMGLNSAMLIYLNGYENTKMGWQ